MFSAALRDHGAAIAVGQRTYGKGVAQSVLDEESYPEYFDGDALKITTSRFFSPAGSTNDIVGVIPTLVISDKNAPAAALLLAQGKPATVTPTLQIALAGQNFYRVWRPARITGRRSRSFWRLCRPVRCWAWGGTPGAGTRSPRRNWPGNMIWISAAGRFRTCRILTPMPRPFRRWRCWSWWRA